MSYHALSNDLHSINDVAFDMVILDEAQRIKNWKTKIAQSVKKMRSPYALVLTGTPVKNEKVMTDALNFFRQLFKAFGKGQ